MAPLIVNQQQKREGDDEKAADNEDDNNQAAVHGTTVDPHDEQIYDDILNLQGCELYYHNLYLLGRLEAQGTGIYLPIMDTLDIKQPKCTTVTYFITFNKHLKEDTIVRVEY